jgi:tetratricopeptide (TPR) repeat protein
MRSALLVLACLVAVGCAKKPKAGESPAAEEPARAGQPADTTAAVGPSSAPTPGPSATVEERVDAAVALLTTGQELDARRAREALDALLVERPEDPRALLNLGVAYFQLGDLERAAATFSRLTRADSSSAKGWLYLGLVERELGDVDAALRRFKAGTALDADDMDLRVAMIRTLRETGRAEEAVAEAKAALRINTRSLPVYSEMGQAYLALGQLDLARFVFEKARTIPGGEDNAELEAYFGRTRYLQGESYVARALLQSAVKKDPGFLPGVVFLAQSYMDDHDYAEAVTLLERAAKTSENNHGLFMNLGIAYRGVGRLEDAAKAWRRALEINPKNPDPHFNLGILQGDDLKDYAASIASFKAYISAGGSQTALAQEYVTAVEKEQEKTERRRAREDDKAKRQAEREERERLIKQDEERKASEPAGDAQPGPWGPIDGGDQGGGE